MKKIQIQSAIGRSSIFVGESLENVSKYLPKNAKIAIITDSTIRSLYEDQFPKADLIIEIPRGESNKTLQSLDPIFEKLIEAEFDRSSFILGIGGGIVCDMSLKVKGLNGLKNLPYVVFQTKKSKRYFMQRPMVDYSGNTLNSGKSEVFSCRMFVPFDTDGITQDDIFEVYLWNNQKTKCLIDNVKITVFEKR